MTKKSNNEKISLKARFSHKLAVTYFPLASIIGAGGLNCCVRDGNRCDPIAKTTKKVPPIFIGKTIFEGFDLIISQWLMIS